MDKPKSEREEITDLVRDVIGTSEGESVIVLVAGVLCDLRRIAAAVEKLQASNPDPKAPMSLRDLTPEEQAAIEGLRRGEIKVVPTKADDAHEIELLAMQLYRDSGGYTKSDGVTKMVWSDFFEHTKEYWRGRARAVRAATSD